MKKLLIEQISNWQFSKQQILESNTLNSGRLIVSGVMQRADTPNQNRRVYPKSLLMRECEKYRQKIQEKRALGELDHPESNTINLRNVSHNVLDVWWQGNDLMGKVEILNTPSGNILKELISAGLTVGISSRGLGSTKSFNESDDGEMEEVLDDFELLCWDFVSDPSTHAAYMRPMNESKSNQKIEKYQHANKLITDIICELSGVCCLQN